MAVNADKPHLWKADIAASVDLFNSWFLEFAPRSYREARIGATKQVDHALRMTNDLKAITTDALKQHPAILPALRMATCPPIARDRLIGLAGTNRNLVTALEAGRLPARAKTEALEEDLRKIVGVIAKMLDLDIFPWLTKGNEATDEDRCRASIIVADRLSGAVSNPVIRNAQERRQLAVIEKYLDDLGYRRITVDERRRFPELPAGTYGFHVNVAVRNSNGNTVNIPVDAVIQRRKARRREIPVLIEAKSAGDFANTNKRRKEEATKVRQLKATYGEGIRFILFLRGYFDSGYLGYEAAEGIDWVWEHRIGDMRKLGL